MSGEGVLAFQASDPPHPARVPLADLSPPGEVKPSLRRFMSTSLPMLVTDRADAEAGEASIAPFIL